MLCSPLSCLKIGGQPLHRCDEKHVDVRLPENDAVASGVPSPFDDDYLIVRTTAIPPHPFCSHLEQSIGHEGTFPEMTDSLCSWQRARRERTSFRVKTGVARMRVSNWCRAKLQRVTFACISQNQKSPYTQRRVPNRERR